MIADAVKRRTKYVSLAFHNNEMVIVHDMGVFTSHFCYSKKQKQGIVVPVTEAAPDAYDAPIALPGPEETTISDEDDI